MSARIANLTFDATDPAALAGFWSEVVGVPAEPDHSIPGTPRLLFIAVPEGKTAKNRCHPDLYVDDRRAEVARLLALGATYVSEGSEPGTAWTVLQDPEGNEFCLAASEPA